jgi:hypothetical protein
MTEEEGETQDKERRGKKVTKRREDIGYREDDEGLPRREVRHGGGIEAKGRGTMTKGK